MRDSPFYISYKCLMTIIASGTENLDKRLSVRLKEAALLKFQESIWLYQHYISIIYWIKYLYIQFLVKLEI